METITMKKKIILALQHVLAMFGATVLVPALTGLDPSIALFTAGVGTLIFYYCTQGKVPVFLGSSFAFVGVILSVVNPSGVELSLLRAPENMDTFLNNLAMAKAGIIVAGLVYVSLAVIVYFVGVEKIQKLFPPVITGPVIVAIGIRLSPLAIENAFYRDGVFNGTSTFIAVVVILTMVIASIFTKGFFKLVPILVAVIVGYLVSIPFGIVDTTSIKDAGVLTLLDGTIRKQLFIMPKFDITAILAIAPIALVVFVEHIGDITTNGAVVGKNFLKDPGIHRTLLGDGLATAVAGFLGGPANTTYSENTGVLAVTKVYDPKVIRLAAIFAIILSFIGPFGATITSIPDPVMGGISILLFGMIASIGMKILVTSQIDFSHSRNMIIIALILVLGIGVGELPVGSTGVTLSGLTIAVIGGIIMNIILPEEI